METKSSKTVERIRKLLSLAEDDGAAPNEADVARQLAERLMAASGITEADIETSVEDPTSTVREERVETSSSRWIGILAVAVARVVGCAVWRSHDGTDVWVGTADQRATAIELHAWLRRQIERLAKGAAKIAREHRSPRSYLNAYRVGVASAISTQARSMVADRPAPAPGSDALVRQDAVKAAINALLPDNLKSRGRVRVGLAGFAAGVADGASVRLRNDLSGGGQRRLRG